MNLNYHVSTCQPYELYRTWHTNKVMHINFEFKAKADNIRGMEDLLIQHNPRFIGTDHQVDTYFNVNN